ncbi:MAG: D-alanyl-D-alanine carboxypeptidase [Alphaproteobacteria bacterium]|nr:D-alanyl-D-alanine carboxypeptidase [Alphaproteobacteria bacterium]
MKGKFLILPMLFFASIANAANYRAAMVADMDTGRVLYSENATDLNYPASLTKIMTLYLTFDALEHGRLHLDDYLIVSNAAANAEPVKLGIPAGSKISVEDAIKAVAVHSANDVARVLAENLKGGKEGSFASLMTRVAREIGLSKTNFENSSGLPDDDHLSTARDIALVSLAVYKHFPQYWKYFGIKSWTYGGKTYTNGNRLLATYPGCDGMKTGYTNKSKYSLVATAKRGDKHLMAVVLGAENKDVRAAVSAKLLDKGFDMLAENPAPKMIVRETPVTAPVDTAPKAAPVYDSVQSVNTFAGAYHAATNHVPSAVAQSGPGVQFGAFSSRESASKMIATVKNATGATPIIETAPNGLFRVRVYGLSESAAQSLKTKASASGIDCYVFH